MNRCRALLFCCFLLFCKCLTCQTSVGLGLYPTGTEAGLGFRLNKDKRLSCDARIAKANFYSKPNVSSCITELSAIWRVILLEKVRLHLGLGFRTEWNPDSRHKVGGVIPVGVEAFPFSFQNAGLIFEVAPFYAGDDHSNWSAGIRTVAGFVFYFPKQNNTGK